MAWRIGVDSGGTFTDIFLFDDATGSLAVWKVASTPDDPSRGIAAGAAEAIERVGADLALIGYFGHGTTVATNALIQNRGARTALITTEGFRDLLEIGRQKRPDLYDTQADKPAALVSRDLRLEVAERVRHDGSVEIPLDETAFREAVRRVRAAGVASVAVCFLYSFVAEAHEKIAAQILAEEFPEAYACVSHAIAPEFREFERMSTAVVNAYLGPVMQTYIRRLADRLTRLGLPVAPHLTQSNGGVISFEQAERLPVRTVLSGPSTGVVAAREVGRQTACGELITFDMGGTSTDVALLAGGECRLASEAVVHGYPIKAPMLDIHAEQVDPRDRRTVRTVDMRYAGQNYELPIRLPNDVIMPCSPGVMPAEPAGPRCEAPDSPSSLGAGAEHGRLPIRPQWLQALAGAFAAAHQRLYGFADDDEPVQLVTFRLEASAVVPKATFAPQPGAGPDPRQALIGQRQVWLPEAGGAVDCPVFERTLLRAGNLIHGPAIIEQMDATTVVLPEMTARVEPYLNLILEAA